MSAATAGYALMTIAAWVLLSVLLGPLVARLLWGINPREEDERR